MDDDKKPTDQLSSDAGGSLLSDAAKKAADKPADKVEDKKPVDQKTDDTKVEDKKADDKPADKKEEVKYDLKLPKDSKFAPALSEKTVAIARKLGLSNEQAQEVFDLAVQEVASTSKSHEDLLKANQPGGADWVKQRDGWAKEALADKEIGNGNPELLTANVNKAAAELLKYFPMAVIDFLHQTGFGSHPDVIRGALRLAKASGEGSLLDGSGSGKKEKKSTAELFYGSSTPKKES